MDTYQQITEAAGFLQPYITQQPKVAVILGSGLGNFVNEIAVEKETRWKDEVVIVKL